MPTVVPVPCVVLQLRVIRAFKSTLEDLEEQRSVHSLHSLRSSRSHSGLRPMSDITYIDEEGGPSIKASSQQGGGAAAAAASGEQLVVNDYRCHPAMAGGVVDGFLGVGSERDWDRDRNGHHRAGHHGHHGHHGHYGHHGRSANNNRPPPPLLKGSGVNGHGAGGRPSEMAPSQILIATPYQPLSPQHLAHMNLPAVPAPSGLLPVGLDFISLPDLPDLPRLVHETSI